MEVYGVDELVVHHGSHFLTGILKLFQQFEKFFFSLDIERNVVELDSSCRFQARGFVEVLGPLSFEERDGRVGACLEEIVPRPEAVWVVTDGGNQRESHDVSIEADGFSMSLVTIAR